MQLGRAQLVGRRAELDRLQAALDDAVAGRSGVVVVAGEAGIGKTRLLDDFVRLASDRAIVLEGQCVDAGVAPLPYAAITGILRDLIERIGIDEVLDVAGPNADALGAALPGAIDVRGDARIDRLPGVVAELLGRVANERPLVVILEDLHWADGATLGILHNLVLALAETPTLLVLSYRSDDVGRHHPLRPLVAELERSRVAERVELRRLDDGAVGELLAELLGREPTPIELEDVLERSEGVPFYVEELASFVGNALPDSLRELLLLRYERLDERTRAFLRVVAAGGVSVRHDVLAAVFEGQEEELDAAARAAVHAHVLVSGDTGYTFRHALMQEAVHAELLPGERSRVHSAFARAYEHLPPDASTLSAIADHWWQARNPERALAAAVTAQTAALAAWAASSAAALGERALELWEQIPDAEQVAGIARPVILARTSRALHFAGRMDRAIDLAQQALDEWPEDDRVGLAELLGRFSFAAGQSGVGDALELAERGLALLRPDDDPGVRAGILLQLERALLMRNEFDRAIAVGTEAFEWAKRAGDDPTASMAANLRGVARVGAGDPAGLDDLALARDLAGDDPFALPRYFINGTNCHLLLGDYERALELATEGAEQAQRLGAGFSARAMLESNAMDAALALGRDWDRVESWSSRLIRLLEPSVFTTYLRLHVFWLLVWGGRFDEADQYLRGRGAELERFADIEVQIRLPLTQTRAELAAFRGDPARALELASVVIDPEHRRVPVHDLRLLAIAARAIAALREQGIETDLAPYRAALEASRDWPTAGAWIPLFEAELGEAPWEPVAKVAAPAHLRSYARWRWGAQLLADGDRKGAAEQLRLAADEADRIGVGAVADAARAVLRDAGLDDAESAADGDELTLRERQVLDLVAEGLSNSQIAARLYISAKTVSVHVSAILRKLGVSTRTEAAVRARQPADAG